MTMPTTPIRSPSDRAHSPRNRPARRWLTTVLAVSFITAACSGAPVAPPAPTAAPPAPTAAPAAAAKPAAGAPAASNGAPLNVRLLVTITDRCCLNYIPILIGGRLGMFEKNGLNVDWIPQVPGASPAMAPTLSGQADVTLISAAGAVAAAGAGRPARIMSIETLDVWAGMAVQPEIAAKLATQ